MPRVSVNGADLYFEERGSGPPILLIHGLGGNADVWGASLDQLAQDHRVLAYDRRGYTRSGQVPRGDFRRDGEDAAAVLRGLDAAPAMVVGWSGGGIVAFDLAVHHPDLVAGLVLLEPTLHAKKRPGMRQIAAFLKANLMRRIRNERAGTEAFLRWAFRHKTGGTWYDRLPDSMREGLLANGAAAMSEMDIGTGEHLSDDQIAAIACPAVILVGELSDPIFARVSERTARLLPHGRIERIRGAGHVIHLERPAEFVRAVREAAPPGSA
jgi:pimeloyl-ACP methyl ester carboxylesterase